MRCGCWTTWIKRAELRLLLIDVALSDLRQQISQLALLVSCGVVSRRQALNDLNQRFNVNRRYS